MKYKIGDWVEVIIDGYIDMPKDGKWKLVSDKQIGKIIEIKKIYKVKLNDGTILPDSLIWRKLTEDEIMVMNI